MPKASHIPKDEHAVMTLAMSKEDKRILKTMAAERDVSVAFLIHEWIQEHRKGDGDDDSDG